MAAFLWYIRWGQADDNFFIGIDIPIEWNADFIRSLDSKLPCHKDQ